jgi:hypothetical protein
MYTDSNFQPIDDNAPYTDRNGVKYPANFPKSEISDLSLVTEIPRPDDTATHYIIGYRIDNKNMQVWETAEKSNERKDSEALMSILNARQSAYNAKGWTDPYQLIDDILTRGILAVKADRDAIKSIHPKPTQVTE